MGKVHYDSSALKGLSVLPFLKQVERRNEKIAEAPDTLPESDFNANRLAASLHPPYLCVKIAKVIDRGWDTKSYVLVPNPEKGTMALPFFRAGQYVSVIHEFEGHALAKPYSICSSPRDALGTEANSYMLTIQKGTSSSLHVYNDWQEGTEVLLSAPIGDDYYERLRDAKKVIACAGGSGITPFYSMAGAIADGLEDFELTILYGNRCEEAILMREELDDFATRSKGKVKIIHVLSDEVKEGFEHGFITAELIRKYAETDDYSVFICGAPAMVKFLKGELAKLELPRRRIRFSPSGEFGDPALDSAYPSDVVGKVFTLTGIHHGGEEFVVECPAERTILQAFTLAGCYVQSGCRSGQCGWCRSRLVSGEVFVPEVVDGRRSADKKFNWIHPCVTYPLSDLVIELPS